MMPGRPFPYTRNSSCSGSAERRGQHHRHQPDLAGQGLTQTCNSAGASSQGGRNQEALLAPGPACPLPSRSLPRAARGSRSPPSPPSFAALRHRAGLTFAGLPVTPQAEPGAAPAGASLVAVPQQADIRAAPRLAELVWLAGMAPHYIEREQGMGSGVHLLSPETIEAAQGQPCPRLVAPGLGSPVTARSRAWHGAEIGRGLPQNLGQGGAESSTPCPSILLKVLGHAASVLPLQASSPPAAGAAGGTRPRGAPGPETARAWPRTSRSTAVPRAEISRLVLYSGKCQAGCRH